MLNQHAQQPPFDEVDTFATQDILLVDDEPQVVHLVVEVLEDAGYRVRVASNGREALASISTAVPRLLLLDLLMPDINGYDVLNTLRGRQISPMTIVAFTANRVDEGELRRAGAADILPKPFMIDDLLNCVARYVQPS